MKLNIIYEDEHLLVLYKPAGVPVQSARVGAKDCESLLKNYLFEKYCIKDDVKIAEIIEKSGNIDKGFVVVDMPESCRNCMFSAEHEIPLNGHYFCRIL